MIDLRAARSDPDAFRAALAGQDVTSVAESVEHARGVEAHLEEHGKDGPK